MRLRVRVRVRKMAVVEKMKPANAVNRGSARGRGGQQSDAEALFDFPVKNCYRGTMMAARGEDPGRAAGRPQDIRACAAMPPWVVAGLYVQTGSEPVKPERAMAE